MKTKKYEVFYWYGDGTHLKTHRVYKGIGAARADAQLITRNPAVTHIEIIGYDEMAHRNFKEIVHKPQLY